VEVLCAVGNNILNSHPDYEYTLFGKYRTVQVPLAQIQNATIMQQPAAQLPWFHICTL
jgi:hypothetical protein